MRIQEIECHLRNGIFQVGVRVGNPIVCFIKNHRYLIHIQIHFITMFDSNIITHTGVSKERKDASFENLWLWNTSGAREEKLERRTRVTDIRTSRIGCLLHWNHTAHKLFDERSQRGHCAMGGNFTYFRRCQWVQNVENKCDLAAFLKSIQLLLTHVVRQNRSHGTCSQWFGYIGSISFFLFLFFFGKEMVHIFSMGAFWRDNKNYY